MDWLESHPREGGSSSLSTPPEPAKPFPTVTRRIDLDPADWFLAPWRDPDPLPRPGPVPFHRPDRCDRLLKVRTSAAGRYWDWSEVELPVAMTHEEAHFWLRAMLRASPRARPRVLARQMSGAALDGPADLTFCKDGIPDKNYALPGLLLAPLAVFLPPLRAVNLVLDWARRERGNFQHHFFVAKIENLVVRAFDRHLLPFLGRDEREQLRQDVRREIARNPWTFQQWQTVPVEYRLAARLNMPDVVNPLVAGWAPGQPDVHGVLPELVLGLGEPHKVERHTRRLLLRLTHDRFLRGWLAHLGLEGLGWVEEQLLSYRGGKGGHLVDVLCLVRAPEVAPILLRLRRATIGPRQVRAWLDEEVGNAVAGLLPLAGRRDRLGEMAIDYLRDVRRRGHAEFLSERLTHADPATAARVRRRVLDFQERDYPEIDPECAPDWLRSPLELSDEGAADPLPPWYRYARTPALLLEGRRLGEPSVETILRCLRLSSLKTPPPLVRSLKREVPAEQLDAFAWRLFELWQADGAPGMDSWVMNALAHLGGDETAVRLAGRLQHWPAQGQLPLTLHALDCLKAIRTPIALQQLADLARRGPSRRLREEAAKRLQEVARGRGVTADELEERAAPDAGLDERGQLLLDFGPRSFRATLGPDLEPRLFDESGRARRQLPRPASADDPEKAARATGRWRSFRREVRQTLRVHALRLEEAMVQGRRWNVEAFRSRVLGHPILSRLASHLLWGLYLDNGPLVTTFRLTEDHQLSNLHDESCALLPELKVGVVHPVQLTPDEHRTWGAIFKDYEIIAPFDQLAHGAHRIEPEEASRAALVRHAGLKVNALQLLAALGRRGWEQQWAGCDGRVRYFPASDLSAFLQLHGWNEMQVEKVSFLRGRMGHGGYYRPPDGIALGQVDAVTLSEVIDDLDRLAVRVK